MLYIRQGATHKVVIGPAVAVGDGFTPVTTLALNTADEAEVILHDNGTVVDISGYTFAAIATADGYYHLTLQSGISNTVGHMTVVIHDDSLILPLRADFTVIEEAIYDAMFAASANAWSGAAGASVVQAQLIDGVHGGVSATWTASSETIGTVSLSDVAIGGELSVVTNSIPWNAAWDTEVQSEVQDAITASSLPTAAQVWASGTRTLTALDEDTTTLDLDATIAAAVPSAATIATSVLTTAMTEAYRSAGATATLSQACYELIAHMGDSSISSTTKTLKKLDGTTAKTFTLDSASTPTSITEAT